MQQAFGTDIGTSGLDTLGPWGMNGHELAHLVAAGARLTRTF